jgi:lipopolysaccharide heptosyltransferase II
MTNVVLLVPNWLGDCVMALPAIRDVRRHFAGAHLTVAARASVAKLFRAVPGIDEILTFKTRKDEIGQLQAAHFDLALLFPNSFRSAWITRRAGISERWGYRSDFRGPLLTRTARRPKGRVHFGAYYQELVRQFGIETGPLTPRLELPSTVVEASRKLLIERGWTPDRALVGIAPGAAFGHAKRWPARQFASLVAMVRGDLGAACVLLGRDDDRDASQAIEEFLNAEGQDRRLVINLVGQTELMSFMGVIANCAAFVANDSGALHVAAALDVPVVAIYGPTSEQFSRPLTATADADHRVVTLSEDVFCRPCWLRDCPIDHRCMRRISPDRVYASVRQFLEQETHA